MDKELCRFTNLLGFCFEKLSRYVPQQLKQTPIKVPALSKACSNTGIVVSNPT
jgi:hypothetical protein